MHHPVAKSKKWSCIGLHIDKIRIDNKRGAKCNTLRLTKGSHRKQKLQQAKVEDKMYPGSVHNRGIGTGGVNSVKEL